MGPCPSVLMWCFTSPVFPNSPVDVANISFLLSKKLIILLLSTSDMSVDKLFSKSNVLGDSSSSVHELILTLSTLVHSMVPITSYLEMVIVLFVSLTIATVKTGSLLLVLLLINGSNLNPLFSPDPFLEITQDWGEAELHSLPIQRQWHYRA